MIPYARDAMSFLVQRLLTQSAPELKTNFALADLAMITQLMQLFGQDYGRAAQARLDDIREVRAIFESAGEFPSHSKVGELINEASGLSLRDVHVDALDRALDVHFRALIELHTEIERRMDSGDRDARRVNTLIWDFLERHTERHRYDIDA